MCKKLSCIVWLKRNLFQVKLHIIYVRFYAKSFTNSFISHRGRDPQLDRVHTRPGNPGKPGNVLKFCLVLEKVLEFFKNKDLSWISPEKINAPLYLSSFVIIAGDSMMRQQIFFSLLNIYFL